MSLSLVTPRAVSRLTLSRIISIRAAHATARPEPAAQQVCVMYICRKGPASITPIIKAVNES